mmetsp:Transcript_20838/g.65533  ORF Transcript_20838/g.65533 Transcript_20838/m.65533 type:complete len:326 (+) Transcript_20838:534-1511(+)
MRGFSRADVDERLRGESDARAAAIGVAQVLAAQGEEGLVSAKDVGSRRARNDDLLSMIVSGREFDALDARGLELAAKLVLDQELGAARFLDDVLGEGVEVDDGGVLDAAALVEVLEHGRDFGLDVLLVVVRALVSKVGRRPRHGGDDELVHLARVHLAVAVDVDPGEDAANDGAKAVIARVASSLLGNRGQVLLVDLEQVEAQVRLGLEVLEPTVRRGAVREELRHGTSLVRVVEEGEAREREARDAERDDPVPVGEEKVERDGGPRQRGSRPFEGRPHQRQLGRVEPRLARRPRHGAARVLAASEVYDLAGDALHGTLLRLLLL